MAITPKHLDILHIFCTRKMPIWALMETQSLSTGYRCS